MDKNNYLKLFFIAVVWTASVILTERPAYPAAEPIEHLPGDIVKLGTGISRIPRSLYSPGETYGFFKSAAGKLWQYSRPEAPVQDSAGGAAPKGIRIRYAF